MVNLIFCLSMSGGHMTYLGVLCKLLLQHIPINYDYITKSGAAHNGEEYFPEHVPPNFDCKNYEKFLENSIKKYTYKDTCIIKDSWNVIDFNVWSNIINSKTNTISLISSPTTKLDWLYAYVSFNNKVPTGVYDLLKLKNPYFKIWHMLPNKHKRKILSKSMPVAPLRESLDLTCNALRFPTTEILDISFPKKVHNFLIENNHASICNNDIIEFHSFFVSKQLDNLKIANDLINNIQWEPKNFVDKIFFEWLDTNPWEGLE